MPSLEDLFRSAKVLVEGASNDFPQFETRCNAFLKESKLEFFTDEHSEPGKVIHKVRIFARVPDSLERDAIHLVGDLRSALDKATNAASVLIGTTDAKHTSFPAADSEAQLRGQLNAGGGPYRGIPRELHDYLINLRPYWDQRGNQMLRYFLLVSNPTKHESILSIDVNFDGIGFNEGNFYFDRVMTVWNEEKTECEIFRTLKARPPQGQIRVNHTVTFNNAGAGFAARPFVPEIRQVLRVVNGVVLGLEAETRRILATRA
jgi:hypothetical protein